MTSFRSTKWDKWPIVLTVVVPIRELGTVEENKCSQEPRYTRQERVMRLGTTGTLQVRVNFTSYVSTDLQDNYVLSNWKLTVWNIINLFWVDEKPTDGLKLETQTKGGKPGERDCRS